MGGPVYIGGLGLGPVWSITLKPPDLLDPDMSHGTRWQFRYALITYAQCGTLDPFKVSDHFTSLNAECIIGRELHEDGGTHLHVFADWGTKFRSRNVNVFDVDGHHPNVSPSKGRPGKGWDYATKDGDIVAGGLERPCDGDNKGGSLRDKATQILDARSKKELFEACRDLAPDKLLWNYPSMRAYANDAFPDPVSVYGHPEEITLTTGHYPALDEWVRRNLGRTQTGESCTSLRRDPPSAKASAAKAGGPPLLARVRLVLIHQGT